LRTRVGDANLDGRVDFTDFLRVAENFGNSASWSDGNFAFTPVVEFADFLALAENFGFERSLAQAANGG
jgi:hypothetical protein